VPGRGVTFTLRLPLSLTIVRGLVLRAGEQVYAMPLASITEVHRLQAADVEEGAVRLGGRLVPAVRLADVVAGRPGGGGAAEERPVALTVHVGGRATALLVDAILDTRDLLVKSLGAHLRHVPGLAGATLLGDGRVVPLLEPAVAARHLASAPLVLRAPAPAASVAAGPLRVLIVDDSLSVRRVLATLAARMGWDPLQARDGVDALEVLQRLPAAPDVILLDVEMPRLDGFELTATLRAQDAYRAVPIVMITSRGGEKHRQKAFGLGVTEYLVKPFDEEALVQTVGRLTRRAA
jgi:chemosensory pili system protein ChpA (sensor histidine kinase/response regulator)